MESVLITGGTGFFGKSLLRYLASGASKLPGQVFVLARDPIRFRKIFGDLCRDIELLNGDVLKPESLPSSIRVTHVLHAAGASSAGDHVSYLDQFNLVIAGTSNMLAYARRCGAERFILTSSGAVYGPSRQSLSGFAEDHLSCPDSLDPRNAYGVAKRAAEMLCGIHAREGGLGVVSARCFAFIGADLPLDVHYAIGNFIRDALWSDEIIVNGDGTPIRSYLDQRDLAHWLMTLLRDGKAGEAYNVGSDREISIADLAHLVRDLVGPEKPVRILGKPVDNADRSRYVPDISKIHTHLGLRPTYTLEESILDTAAAARARGKFS